MRKEIKRRKLFFGINTVLILICAIFIWTNDLFYSRKNSDAKLEKGKTEYGLNLPSYLSDSQLSDVSPLHGNIEDSVIKRLNSYRQNNDLPILFADPAWNKFARKLAYLVSKGTEKSEYNPQVQNNVFIEFPKMELRVIHDKISLPSSDSEQNSIDISDYWINRDSWNNLNNENYNNVGVGVVSKNNRLYAFLFLVEPLFYYDQNFPLYGDISLTGKIANNQVGKKIRFRKYHYTRGWFKNIKENIEDGKDIVINNNKFKFELTIPEKNWCRIVFIVDGEEFNKGRAVNGKAIKIEKPLP